MQNNYVSNSHCKYYLKVHLIFVTKYRKNLLVNGLDTWIKREFEYISNGCDFSIDIMGTNKNHIHLLVSYPPSISVSSIVRKLKQKSTADIWKRFYSVMRIEFWKEHTFWSDGYFACSIGEASPETIRNYIENQG